MEKEEGEGCPNSPHPNWSRSLGDSRCLFAA